MALYGAYNFRDKDPVVDQMRTLLQDHYGRGIDHAMLNEIKEAGGPTVACMKGWFDGKTRRPQNCTIEAAGRAAGFERRWVRLRASNGKAKKGR